MRSCSTSPYESFTRYMDHFWRCFLVPGYAGWVLANNGFEGQQTSKPADPNKPHNLWKPIAGDHGPSWSFD